MDRHLVERIFQVMKLKVLFLVSVVLSAVVLALLGSWYLPAASASNRQQSDVVSRTITVVGEGSASAPADIARVNIGVQVSDPDVKIATDKAAAQMESVLSALQADGIAENDIQTSYYNVYVDRPYSPQGQPGEPVYQVSNSMQVTIRDLTRITEILGLAIESGANSINSVEFRLSDPTSIRSEARAEAVTNAEAQAAELAKLNGVAVGGVTRISEVIDSGAYFVSEQSYDAAQGYGGGGGGPISPGNVTVSVQLQIEYSMVQ
jgi:uncharacterized protein YggE